MANYQFGSFTKSRIEAFSDGVFAIVVTLLVLEIKIPDFKTYNEQLIANSIFEVLPKILIWMNSFLVVCVIWMNHHRLMEMFKGVDIGIFWFNNLLLMFTSLVPFPTAIAGAYSDSKVALCFYGICMSLMSTAFYVWRLYVQRHPDLLKEEVSFAAFRKGTWLSFVYGTGFYLVGAAVSWLNTWAAFIIYFFIAAYFILPRATRTKD
jgi:uncharacterized membrane protein